VRRVGRALGDEHVLLAGAYGTVATVGGGPVAYAVVTAAYALAGTLMLVQRRRESRDACHGRHALCRSAA
jgi:hypothetical protein